MCVLLILFNCFAMIPESGDLRSIDLCGTSFGKRCREFPGSVTALVAITFITYYILIEVKLINASQVWWTYWVQRSVSVLALTSRYEYRCWHLRISVEIRWRSRIRWCLGRFIPSGDQHRLLPWFSYRVLMKTYWIGFNTWMRPVFLLEHLLFRLMSWVCLKVIIFTFDKFSWCVCYLSFFRLLINILRSPSKYGFYRNLWACHRH